MISRRTLESRGLTSFPLYKCMAASTIILLSFASDLFGQSKPIKWGEPLPVNNFKFVGVENSTKNYLIIKEYDSAIYLIKLDTSGNTVFSKKVLKQKESQPSKNKIALHSKICFKDKILIAYVVDNKESRKYEYNAVIISYDGEELSPRVKLVEINTKFRLSNVSQFMISPDSTKISLLGFISSNEKQEKSKFLLRIMNQDLSQILSKEFDSSSPFDKVGIENQIISNNGEVFFWGFKLNYKDKSIVNGLWVYNMATNSFKEIEINLERKVADNLLCKENSAGEIIITGVFYLYRWNMISLKPTMESSMELLVL